MKPANLPVDVQALGDSPTFDHQSVPTALLSRHALAARSGARLDVLAGEITFVDLRDESRATVAAGGSWVVPPEVPHRVELSMAARVQLHFFRQAGDAPS